MTKSPVFHVVRVIFFSALTYSLSSWTSPAWAQKDLDRCNDILTQSLFNTVNSSSQSSDSERASQADIIFQMNETEAFQLYKKEYKNIVTQKTTANAAGGYGPYSLALAMTHDYGRELKDNELKEAFNKTKEEYRKNSTSSNSKDTSLISNIKTNTRDTTSVKAWEHCMTDASKHPDPGLFAYGYRDPSGSPYIVVMWAPGNLIAVHPVINVKFGLTDPEMTIVGVEKETKIATGSGAAFPVRFKDPNARKAKADGFVVLVNGELRSGDQLQLSFNQEATVPRNIGPMPCSLVFSANKSYQLGVFDKKRGTMSWGFAEVSTMGQGPTGQQGTLVYIGKMTVQQGKSSPPIQVRVTETNVAMSDDKGKTFLTGECTGQGVRAHFANTQFGQNLEVSIRPR